MKRSLFSLLPALLFAAASKDESGGKQSKTDASKNKATSADATNAPKTQSSQNQTNLQNSTAAASNQAGPAPDQPAANAPQGDGTLTSASPAFQGKRGDAGMPPREGEEGLREAGETIREMERENNTGLPAARPDEIKVVITQEILDLNPTLVGQVQLGETVTFSN